MEIIKYPDKRLNTKCDLVKNPRDVIAFLPGMKTLLKNSGGIGLAAPQIGVLSRFFITKHSFDKTHNVFINPIIKNASSRLIWSEEGCLSLPNVTRTILRPSHVTMAAVDEFGNKFEVYAEGKDAFLLFHENDHTLGLTILDRE